jgi:hypothetical protein
VLCCVGLQGTHVHQLRCGSAGPHDESELTVVVHGGGVKRLPDGRPLLHLSYVDHVSAMRQFPSEASHSAPMRRCGATLTCPSADAAVAQPAPAACVRTGCLLRMLGAPCLAGAGNKQWLPSLGGCCQLLSFG